MIPILKKICNVDLIESPDYCKFVKLIERAYIVLTDSGGLQEEAPTFGKPVLVLRSNTERPEGVRSGNAKLIGTSKESIVEHTSLLLEDYREYEKMAKAVSPYGDGDAAKRIRYLLLNHLGIESPKESMWTSYSQ